MKRLAFIFSTLAMLHGCNAGFGQDEDADPTPSPTSIPTTSPTSTATPLPEETNTAPTASEVSITDETGGAIVQGDTLTGVYEYSDAENDTESGSTFSWLRNGEAINNATQLTYTVTVNDVGQNLQFRVIPRAESGTNTNQAYTSKALSVAAVSDANALLAEFSLAETSLNETFEPNVFTYTATVSFLVSNLNLTLRGQNEDVVLSFADADGNALELENDARWFLTEGLNTLRIQVASTDGSETVHYTLTVNRSELRALAQTASVQADIIRRESWFGHDLDLDGTTLAIAANHEDSVATGISTEGTVGEISALESGAVYLFDLVDGQWQQTAYIKAPNSKAGIQFGQQVALSGDWLVVSAPLEDSEATGINPPSGGDDTNSNNTGAIYIYQRRAGEWSLHTYLKAPAVIAENQLGNTLAFDPPFLAVSGRGDNTDRVYMYSLEEGSWIGPIELTAGESDVDDKYGFALALDGNLLAVSAIHEDSDGTGPAEQEPSANNASENSGAVYVYEFNVDRWDLVQFMKASNSHSNLDFGSSLAFYNGTLAVGAFGEQNDIEGSDDVLIDSGAVYVFEQVEGDWLETDYLKAPNPDTGDQFGDRVVLSHSSLLVSAPLEDTATTRVTTGGFSGNEDLTDSGAVYLYTKTDEGWAYSAVMKPENAHVAQQFGNALGLDGQNIVVGAELNGLEDEAVTCPEGETEPCTEDQSLSGAVFIFSNP